MAHGVELHKDSYLLLAVVEKLGIQSREVFFKLRETGWITVSLLTTIFYFFFSVLYAHNILSFWTWLRKEG